MMIEKLLPYAEKKGLTKKEKKEIAGILREAGELDEGEWDVVADCVLGLSPDVAYDFISGCCGSMDDDRKEALCEKVSTPGLMSKSPKTVLYAAVALGGTDLRDKAERLLGNLVFVAGRKKAVDGAFMGGFADAVRLPGGDFLFERHAGMTGSFAAAYRAFLIEYARGSKDGDAAAKARRWFEANGVAMTRDEETVLSRRDGGGDDGAARGGEEVMAAGPGAAGDGAPREQGGADRPGAGRGTVDGLLDELGEMFRAAEAENAELRRSLDDAVSRINGLACEKAALAADLDAERRAAREKSREHECEAAELRRSVDELSCRNAELEGELGSLRERYDGLKAMYEQAGQTEMNAFRTEIRKRLANERAKLDEIKSSGKSIEYYDALIEISDKTFNVLRKYGIEL